MAGGPCGRNDGEARAATALIVAGPTASGKSALALALAERLGGVVINADAMQLYRDLRVLTARPSEADLARAPHDLYGVLPPSPPATAAWWREAALSALDHARRERRVPILCGGSGLYLQALVGGLAAIPPVSDAAREEARARLAALGPAALHAELAARDPETAARLRPQDSQRLARALEVFLATGRGLAAWQAEPATPPAGWRFAAILLDPPRAVLRAAIARRFAAMLEAGALAEVEALRAQNLDPALPILRAHGVPELSAYLRGEITLAEAARRAELVTGQYTKRQATWFRHHRLSAETHTISARIDQFAQFSQRSMADLLNFLTSAGLTPSPSRA